MNQLSELTPGGAELSEVPPGGAESSEVPPGGTTIQLLSKVFLSSEEHFLKLGKGDEW